KLSIAVLMGISGTWFRSQGRNGCPFDISRTAHPVGNHRSSMLWTFYPRATVLSTRLYCASWEMRKCLAIPTGPKDPEVRPPARLLLASAPPSPYPPPRLEAERDNTVDFYSPTAEGKNWPALPGKRNSPQVPQR